jgi:hypothetical protein
LLIYFAKLSWKSNTEHFINVQQFEQAKLQKVVAYSRAERQTRQ